MREFLQNRAINNLLNTLYSLKVSSNLSVEAMKTYNFKIIIKTLKETIK